MSWNSRLCVNCGTRFAPVHADQRSCRACGGGDDHAAVVAYLRAHPGETLTRVALATGVAEERIVAWAGEGTLPEVPAGAEPGRRCTCEPAGSGRCPACREQLAARLAAAGRERRRTPAAPSPRMHVRRS